MVTTLVAVLEKLLRKRKVFPVAAATALTMFSSIMKFLQSIAIVVALAVVSAVVLVLVQVVLAVVVVVVLLLLAAVTRVALLALLALLAAIVAISVILALICQMGILSGKKKSFQLIILRQIVLWSSSKSVTVSKCMSTMTGLQNCPRPLSGTRKTSVTVGISRNIVMD